MRCEGVRAGGAMAACSAALLLASACVVTVDQGRYSVRDEKKFQVKGTPDLALTTFDGSVEIRSWDRPEVLVEIEKRAGDKTQADAIEVRAEQSGDAITIDVKKPAGPEVVLGFRAAPSAKVVAAVPRRCNIVARSGDGSITIERIEGKIDLNTGDGNVKGLDLAGSLRVHTGDGTLRFDRIAGSVDLESGDGGARISGRLGAVKLLTGDGSVEVRADEGSSMTADWEIRTGDGGLRLEVPEGFGATLLASTSDGAVRVNGFGDAATAGGDAQNRRSRSEVRRVLGAGGRLLRLHTGSGTITVKKF